MIIIIDDENDNDSDSEEKAFVDISDADGNEKKINENTTLCNDYWSHNSAECNIIIRNMHKLTTQYNYLI